MRTTRQGLRAAARAAGGAAIGAAVLVQGGCAGRASPGGEPPPSPEAAAAADSAAAGRARDADTRAVGTLETKDLDAQRVGRVEELLQGRIAGVTVNRTPDGDYSVRVRGADGFGGGEPLFVVDGMPITGSLRNALAGLAPADVARIQVLKDAAATSFYGMQGRNGVIVITTKRPKR